MDLLKELKETVKDIQKVEVEVTVDDEELTNKELENLENEETLNEKEED